MEWQEKRASELYISSSGLSKSADQFGFGYPFLSYKDIFNNYYAPDKLQTLVNSSEYERKKCSVKRGDVFLTRTSETTEELGMSCVALKDYPEATFNGFSKRLRPTTEEIVPEYAAYYFRSFYFRNQCKSLASLITRASLNDGMISRLKIRYPLNRSEQVKIGSILLSYDNLIENNNRRIRLLEQMAENLYKEWFVRFRFPGYENAEFENGLPKGWRVATLSSEYNTSSGGTPSRTNMDYYSGSIPWIKTGELQGTFILDTEEHITEEAVRKSSAKLIPEYSLLVAMYAGANVGNLGINSVPATCNQACCVITTKGRYPLNYLKFFLQTQKEFLQSISFGAAQQNISQDIIKKLKVILPPTKLCDTFNIIISPYLRQCELLMRENLLLTNQRDLLLPRLMSGKLEVNV